MKLTLSRPRTLPAVPIVHRATARACRHTRHVGCCSECQRAQLARWDEQLRQVERARFAPRPQTYQGVPAALLRSVSVGDARF
jgi:hypothetical protein